jgi:hypothetical protein
MRRLFLATIGLLAGAGLTAAQAALTLYEDQADFLAAISASHSGTVTQDFSGIALANSSQSVAGQTIGGITFGSGTVYVADPGLDAARFNWGSGAVLAVSVDGATTTLTFAPTTAFGAWFGTADDFEDIVIFEVGAEVSAVMTGAYPDLVFAGFISDTPFTSVTFYTGGSAVAIIDDIIIAIPEPISVALFGAALLGLGVARRRRV